MITQNKVIEEMIRAGAHYGYNKSRRHPSTSSYIFATKNGVDIINVEKTYDLFEKAKEAVLDYAKLGKVILFVGTKAEAKQQVTEVALSLNMPYVGERWVGGILTNFHEIKKRIQKLLDLREQKEKDQFEKYTKKERLLIEREMEDMTKNFQGISGINRVPDALFIIDPKKEHIAVSEAKKMNIPIVALLNTDCNTKQIDYPIIANDASVSSINFFIQAIKDSYIEGTTNSKKEVVEANEIIK